MGEEERDKKVEEEEIRNGRGRERERLRRRREQMGEEERDREREGLRRRREQMEKEEGRERVMRREYVGGIGEERVWGEEGAATTSGRVYLGPMTRVSQYCEVLRPQ